jgi:hypothetical protein
MWTREMRMRNGLSVVAALVTWLAASGAEAATLSVTGYTLGEQVRIAAGGTRGSVYAAEFRVGFEGNDGFSYCVDLSQRIGLGATAGWNAVSPSSNAGVIRAAWLVDRFRGAPGDRTAITGLQLAIWETLADAGADTGYDLDAGAFALEQGGASAGATALARSFLGELAAADLTSFFTSADWLTHSRYQDQLAFTRPIPEPGSIAMFGFGAALVLGAVARKRG